MIVEFLNDTKINGKAYKRGDTLSVSSSISKSLLDVGDAQEYVAPKERKKSKTKSDDTEE